MPPFPSRTLFTRPQPGLALLICLHILACCLSLVFVAEFYSDIVVFGTDHLLSALLSVCSFSLVAVLFIISRFSFGYFVGFYFYNMILGYLWLIEFSRLPYNHSLAIVSIFLSAVAFLAPALFINTSTKPRFTLSRRGFDVLLSLILVAAIVTVAAGATYNFKVASLSDIYKFRADLQLPALLRYAIGITSGALLPFAFACFVASGNQWKAGIALFLLLLLYPITLTKLTLFAPCWLLFLLLLSWVVETRASVILSLFLPAVLGVVLVFLTKFGAASSSLTQEYLGIVNSRMIAMPSLALEVYNHFFAGHPLTHFCQINLLKSFTSCPYSDQLSVIMNRTYRFGAFNASLFATEGIASVGLKFAPLSAFACGLVFALANRLSAGLPVRFVLLSGGILPQILLNVPLSTTLLTNGAASLFLLWYVTLRTIFERGEHVQDR